MTGAATVRAEAWPEADALFRSDPRWLGSDDAYSVPLGGDRILWLFGDTFVDGDTRRDAAFIRNSIGIQRGADPSRASISFRWGRAEDGSFFDAPRGVWYWPLHGALIGDALLLFMMQVRSPAGGDGSIDEWREYGLLGFFEVFGWAALRVENPLDDPGSWRIERVAERTEPIVLGASALVEDEHLVVFGWDETHRLTLARWAGADVSAEPERWTTSGYARPDSVGSSVPDDPSTERGARWERGGTPAVVIEHGATEFSVHRDADGFVQVQMSTRDQALIVRRAPSLTGPWSEPVTLFRPEETARGDGTYVYAGKAHPELDGGGLVCTYASNADVDTCLDDESIYYPRFVRVTS